MTGGAAPVIGVVLGLAWGVVLVVAAWARRPAPSRLRALPTQLAADPAPSPLGTGLAAALADLSGRVLRRPVTITAARHGAVAVLAAVACLPIAAPVAPVAFAAVLLFPLLRGRRARRRQEAAVRRSLPEVVDLLALASGAGLSVPLAVAAVVERASGPVADGLRRAVEQADLGVRLSDALEQVPGQVGESMRPLVAALVASERYGAPLLDRLGRLADEVRADSRRRAEEAARKVPIALLFPLVFCTLPAFALLTLAPMLAGGLRSLRP